MDNKILLVSKLFRAYGLYNFFLYNKKTGCFVSKLYRAYRLYNRRLSAKMVTHFCLFQSSFELTGYITKWTWITEGFIIWFQSSFELTGYITL